LIAGQYSAALPKSNQLNNQIEDNAEEEDDSELSALPTSLPPHEPLILWTNPDDPEHKIQVIPELCCKLRPHQREGVQFLFECTMGLRRFEGNGCILADDMGLGKTFMSITLLWTLMTQGFEKGDCAVRKAVVACPTSLVGNWDNEIKRWVGEKCITFPVKSEAKTIIRNYLQYKGKCVLIVSYDTQRRYSKMFSEKAKMNFGCCCDLLICDEAHKLKNADNQISKSLFALPAKKRILLSGTPMQNELTEFYNMVNFCNPNVLGTLVDFRKKYERPILRAKELDAEKKDKDKAEILQKELSTIVNEFILKRGNILNAKHLPPKLVQVVCCKLSPLQVLLYNHMLNSKEIKHCLEGKQNDTLGHIRRMINICNHPHLIVETYKKKLSERVDDPELSALVDIIRDYQAKNASLYRSNNTSNNGQKQKSGSSSDDIFVDPYLSGKMFVLYRLMQTMRALKTGERIVIVSNYTATLDIIQKLCVNNIWPVLRLDGTTSGQNRTSLVDKFNNPNSGAFAFLLSSKAGGCGINLIGGNRLVLFDPDWNPANDKQALGRIWREGQERRCFIYKFISTGTIEEKIIQRQLSKQSLQSVVDDEEDANKFKGDELRQLFVLRNDTLSDTHDVLRCTRCSTVKILDNAKKNNEMNPIQCQESLQFLNNFITFLKENADGNFVSEELVRLCSELESCSLKLSLPHFSRRLRATIDAVESDIVEGNNSLFIKGFSPSNEFVHRWSEFVPKLAAISMAKGRVDEKKEVDDDGDDEEIVEQEGCPEENELNRWSHHSNVHSCDDETLRKALLDDNTVSFVFGLEVNWSLLQSKEESTRERDELKKKQRAEEIDQFYKNREIKEKANIEDETIVKKKEKKEKQEKGKKEKKKRDDEDTDNDDDLLINDTKTTKKEKRLKKKVEAICELENTELNMDIDSAAEVIQNIPTNVKRARVPLEDEEECIFNDTTNDTTSKENSKKKLKSVSKKNDVDDDDDIDFGDTPTTTAAANKNKIKNNKKIIIDSDDDDNLEPKDSTEKIQTSKEQTSDSSAKVKSRSRTSESSLIALPKPGSKKDVSSSKEEGEDSSER